MPGSKKTRKYTFLGEKIRSARKSLDLLQTDFADHLGTTQSNVAKWERGDYRPSPAYLVKIARLLAGRVESLFFYQEAGVPENYFEKSEADIPVLLENVPGEKQLEMTLVPLLRDPVAAGTPRCIDERDIAARIPFAKRWLPAGAHLYALKVSGDSMAPIINDGNIVIVNTQMRDPRRLVGHMVAAREGDGITVKWLRKDKNTYLLVPQHVSPRIAVRVMRPDDDWDIVGEVVKWIGYPPPIER